jgi:hypothetical protein
VATSLATHRRTLAPLLGVFEQGTADAGASAVDALVCTTGLASGARLKSSTFASSLFEGKWLYTPGAADDDRSRLVAGYDPTTGTLSPDQSWSADPDTLSDRTFEITGLFSGPDLNALVNEGLKKCFVVVEVTFATASNQDRRHSLAVAAPWLTVPDWVYQVGELAPGETRAQTDPFRRVRRGTVASDGTAVYLEGPSFPTTSTVYVRAIKPAYDHCRPSAGTFGAQSGLSLETDESPVDPAWAAWAAILAARDRLDYLEQSGQATAEALRARQMAASRFTLHTRERFVPPKRTVLPVTFVGPSLSGRRWGRRW